MIINQKKKILFISIPKTASESIEEMLLSCSKDNVKNVIVFNSKKIYTRKHVSDQKILNLTNREFLNGYKVFYVSRSFDERVRSDVFYLKNLGLKQALVAAKKIKDCYSFPIYLFKKSIVSFFGLRISYYFIKVLSHKSDYYVSLACNSYFKIDFKTLEKSIVPLIKNMCDETCSLPERNNFGRIR